MAISFNQIPVNLNIPGQFIEYDNSRAVQGLTTMPKKALVIGLRTSSGTVAENTPTMVPSSQSGETFFGHGSQLAQMIEAFKALNPYTELWAIAMDEEGGGVAATGTYTFSGTATEAGSIYTYIGGERIVTAVASGDAADTVDDNVAADITTYLTTSNLPVSAAAASSVVTVTCLHKGTCGNGIKLEINRGDGETTPAGLTNTVVAMASGATDPAMSGPIAVFSDVWYTTIVSALADDTNLDLLEAELLTRWGPMYMKDGHIFAGVTDTLSNMTTAGNARNSQFTTLFGGGLSPTPHWIWASVVAALDEAEPDPARPRQTLLIKGCVAPLAADQLTGTERNTLLTDGVSTYTIGTDGSCYVERLITTYQTNALSLPDPSYLDLCTMRTLAYLRYSLRTRIALRFPRHKLASDGTNFGPGQAIATPALIKSEILALFGLWESEGLVEDFEQFKTDIIVERNSSDVNRVDVLLSPDLMNQFRVFAGQIQFLL
jgi:phage tail sheath gpL-like